MTRVGAGAGAGAPLRLVTGVKAGLEAEEDRRPVSPMLLLSSELEEEGRAEELKVREDLRLLPFSGSGGFSLR